MKAGCAAQAVIISKLTHRLTLAADYTQSAASMKISDQDALEVIEDLAKD